ncbi:hypothetical protein CBS147343_7903 [Aspergillus niger]|nr:hypothetical protein CBS11350_7930 [Aspergillus niger]KAI2888984.1 hypothetical protein CBS11852_6996 [Aspergillus niger]KAI2912525.1 hypothetical protein CBS147371_7403 [Aspergillus niger]KAI2935948.1 hypothetical protein CBS147320_181 [Aspergillus niger]KAI2960358.1 hypothetical protein CBS147324_10061 [Aspergillus niger]
MVNISIPETSNGSDLQLARSSQAVIASLGTFPDPRSGQCLIIENDYIMPGVEFLSTIDTRRPRLHRDIQDHDRRVPDSHLCYGLDHNAYPNTRPRSSS